MMKFVQFLESFPVYTLDITKSETRYQTVDEIIAYLSTLIEAYPSGRLIGVFDHYAHVSEQDGSKIDPDIIAAKNVLFCLSHTIPNALVGALRPHSIAINELNDKFVINFLEAPSEVITKQMQDWVKDIKNKS